MLTLQEKLGQVPWESLHHAYGPAQDTPSWLLALLSDEAEQRDHALDKLWGSICHQGSVYAASCAAVPFLIEILAEVPDQRKPEILSLLEGLAHVSWYANKDQRFLRMEHSSRRGRHQGYQWFSWGEFLIAGNEYHEPQWMHQAHQLVAEGIPVFLTLLQSPDKDVVKATLDLLAGFQEQNALLIPVVAPLAFEEAEAAVQIAAQHCLGVLLEPPSPYWEEYRHLAQTSDALPAVTFAAAYILVLRHPSSASQATVKTLLASVLPPQSCYGLRDICEALSHLGNPLGVQGLVDALNAGAEHWSILDTIRVAEALLDVVFFGGWVQNRYWNCATDDPIFSPLFASEEEHTSVPDTVSTNREEKASTSNENLLSQEEIDLARFRWGYSTGSSLGDFAITTFGYDEEETQRLQSLFAQEGQRALSDPQRMAIRTLLQCEPLWKVKQNLLAVYGLPTTKHELEVFLTNE